MRVIVVVTVGGTRVVDMLPAFSVMVEDGVTVLVTVCMATRVVSKAI